MRQRRAARPKLVLTDAQIHYLKTGDHNRDPDVYLDWAHPNNRAKVRRVFLAIRDDYPAGAFPWAEKEFGGKR
jgi:hypothetical protein